MNKKALKIFTFTTLSIFVFSIVSCGKKTTADPEPAKTLNKSLLVGKKWYNQGGTITHDIKANGVYGSSGTWYWKNTSSDTMVLDIDGSGSSFPSEEWKFFWSAEHEMACKRATSSSGEILYKDQAW